MQAAQRRLDADLAGTGPGVIPSVKLMDCVVHDATLVLGASADLAIADASGTTLPFSTTFTTIDNIPGIQPPQPAADQPAIPALFVGFDGAWWNWYHWNVFGIRRMALAHALLPPDTRIAVPSGIMQRPNWKAALDAIGLGSRMLALEPGRYRVSRLHVLLTDTPHPTDIVYLDAFHGATGTPDLPQRRLIAVRRSQNARLGSDESTAVSAVAARLGMEQVDLAEHGFAEQQDMFAGAALVVAAHGAGLANLMHCRPGTRVLELNRRLDGEAQTRPWFYQIAAMRGLPYMSLDGDAGEVTEPGLESAIRRLLTT